MASKATKRFEPVSHHVTVNAAALFAEMTFVKGATERRSSIPILTHVLIMSPTKDTLTIAATNLDVSNRASLEAKATDRMAVCVDAGTFTNVLKGLIDEYGKGADVELHHQAPTLGQDKVTIVCGKSQTILNATAAGDFPSIPAVDGDAAATFELSAFQQLIRDVSFAMTAEETAFERNGALLTFDRENLEVATTNGHQMAIRRAPVILNAQPKEWHHFLGHAALDQALRLSAEGRAELILLRTKDGDPSHAVVRYGHREVIARHIPVNFPNYRAVIAGDLDKSIIFDRKAALRALGRAKRTANEHTMACRFLLKRGSLVIETRDPNNGETREELPAEYSGPPLFVGLKITYLVNMLTALPTEKVQINAKDEASQITMLPVGDDLLGEYLHVLMPMKLGWADEL